MPIIGIGECMILSLVLSRSSSNNRIISERTQLVPPDPPSHRGGCWIGSCDDAGNEHRFMQNALQLMKYLDPLGDNCRA
jgi:hypothetical protein